MLVAISGSQGSGKSTVLAELAKRGYRVVARKTSRSIMKEWGVTLQEVNASRELTLRFQDEISSRKYKDELDFILTDEVWFTERTHADLFTYALVSLGKDNINSDWINEYYIMCEKFQRSYSQVFYIRAGIFDVKSDGVRGDNPHYSTMVDETMRKFTWMMSPDSKSYHGITQAHVEDRVDFILDTVYNRQK